MREVVEDHVVEVAPDELVEVDVGVEVHGAQGQLANTDGPETQVDAHPARAFARRDVAVTAIILQDLVAHRRCRDVGEVLGETHGLERDHVATVDGGQGIERAP